MGLFSGDIHKAAEEIKPILDEVVSRLRQVVYESEERLNGAEIIIPEIRITIKLPPVSPPKA